MKAMKYWFVYILHELEKRWYVSSLDLSLGLASKEVKMSQARKENPSLAFLQSPTFTTYHLLYVSGVCEVKKISRRPLTANLDFENLSHCDEASECYKNLLPSILIMSFQLQETPSLVAYTAILILR